MNARIATTLINANPYSTSPKTLTCAVLMTMSAAAIPPTHSHGGTPGNQKPK